MTVEAWISVPVLLHGEPSTPTLLQQLRHGAQRGAPETAKRAAAQAIASSDVDASVGGPGLVLRQVSESVDVMVIGSRRWGTIAPVVLDGAGETLVADCGSSLIVTCRARWHTHKPA